MSPPALPKSGPMNLNDVFGSVLIGAMISVTLFGVTSLQAWRYFQTYRDRPLLRGTVAFVFLLGIAHYVLVIHAMYHYLILNFGNIRGLFTSSWSIVALVWITGVNTYVVHLFYVHYVWQISKRNTLLAGFILLLSTAHFGCALVIGANATRLRPFQKFAHYAHNIATASLSTSAAADLSIAISVSYLLHTSRSGWKTTDTLINRLIVYAIHTGMLTSAVDILILVYLKAQRDSLVFVAIFFVLGNLYGISMLATLNARRPPSNGTSVEGPTSLNITFDGTESTPEVPGQTSHISIPLPTRVHVHSATEKAYS